MRLRQSTPEHLTPRTCLGGDVRWRGGLRNPVVQCWPFNQELVPFFSNRTPLERRQPAKGKRLSDVFGQSLRAREGECELGTLAIGKRCQERISATGWAW